MVDRTASTANTSPIEDPLDKAIAKSSSEDGVSFTVALLVRLTQLQESFRLAKVMVVGSQEVQILGFIKDNWQTNGNQMLQAVRFGARSLDQYQMPAGYGKFGTVGGIVHVPIANIRGFMWVAPKEESQYYEQFTHTQEKA